MSIHKKQSGKYEVRWREGGRQKSRSFTMEADAKRFDREVLVRMETRGMTRVDQGVVTLGEFITQTYWPNRAEQRLSKGVRNQYQNLYQRYVHEQLSGYQLRELSTRTLLDWQAGVEQELPAPSLIKLMTFLTGALSYAVQRDEIAANPMRELDKPKQATKLAPIPLTPTEVEQIRSQLGERDKTIVSVLAYAGLRPGELTRLHWQDVGEQSLRVAVGKTNRERSAILLPPVKADLDAWQNGSSGLVFSGFDLDNWRKRIWKPAFHNARIMGRDNPYRMRSSFVSLLLADPNYTLGEIAMSAGHGLDIMGRHYANQIHELQGKQVDAVNEIYSAREQC